ncbi:2-phospho-L-lactate guanylyltransferase [Actinophytocola sp.]|uniref:2-phospho-L-lactate guanylyltransferase n=1 Tax=Actinophytocola sp. TaxID=1872138 RepID=UPI0039C8884F
MDLIVPVKRLDRAKSRLRGVLPGHVELVLALLADTVTAAGSTPGVRRVLVVCEDERVPPALRGTAAECVDERGLPGLNAALRFGADRLRAADPGGVVGALQADLPALRPADLAAALAEAAGRRMFCADRAGTGSTLLLSAPGGPLDPRFGAGSAAAHAESGALPVTAPVPSLRADVDTPDDLAMATDLGLGRRTSTLVCVTHR